MKAASRGFGMGIILTMISKELKKIQPWMLNYTLNRLKSLFSSETSKEKHVFFCLCDHFEPLRGNANTQLGLERVKTWHKNYPKIAASFKDSDNTSPKHSFFYPEEEYQEEYLNLLSEICHKGFGEVEIHLHHDNDTDVKLREKLDRFKDLLKNRHKLLSVDKSSNETKYGFIHGNWALDNSRPDGRKCGVNNELDILLETGCYADFTMPSAPDCTQTYKINSLYLSLIHI